MSPRVIITKSLSRSILMRLSPSTLYGKMLKVLPRALPSPSCVPLGKLLNPSLRTLPRWKNVIGNRPAAAWVVVGTV